MNKAVLIGKREIHSSLVTPVAYVLVSGFVLLSAYFFFTLLQNYRHIIDVYNAQPVRLPEHAPDLHRDVIEPYFRFLLLFLVFVAPIISMRAFPEEKRSGSLELLCLSPLSTTSLIAGKFMALAFLSTAMIALSSLLPFSLWLAGSAEIFPLLSGLLGVLIYAFALLALALAVSALTSSQLTAAMSGIVLLLFLYVADAPAESVSSGVAGFLRYLTPRVHASAFIGGVIETGRLVYFASVFVIGIFLSVRILDFSRGGHSG